MNKRELVEEVADQAGISKRRAKNVLDAITEAITNALSNGEKITLVDFGTFRVAHRKAREGRNPQTGEKLEIPAKKVPKFRAGKKLREAVR